MEKQLSEKSVAVETVYNINTQSAEMVLLHLLSGKLHEGRFDIM